MVGSNDDLNASRPSHPSLCHLHCQLSACATELKCSLAGMAEDAP